MSAALSFALCGMLLIVTMQSGQTVRGAIAKGLIGAALAGVALSGALRPGVRRAETAGRARGPVSGQSIAGCGFADVAANENALRSLRELRDYLRDPEKYARYGARMPQGVLLYGPPGTGKTLLARALAGEAGVPFFALAGSDFVEKYVGVGASRVRELFSKARRAGKAVIFIDEIDAMGKRRDDSVSDERDQTLNALLSEMSGFHGGEGILVIAATNRPEALDPALLRPGRFDRQIEVALPGRNERLSILRLHSRNKPMGEDVDLEAVAAQTVSFSGAGLESLLNEAAILAASRNDGTIAARDIQRAFIKTTAGEDRPCAARPEERRVIAAHEAGHALATLLLQPENRLTRVSILPAGRGAAGYSLSIPAERVMPGKADLENQICALLAGRAAEQLSRGPEGITAGAASDLTRATELAAAMVTELGMAGEPAVSLKALARQCGGAGDAAPLCRRILSEQYERALALLSAHREAHQTLADALLEREALDGREAEAVLREALSKERQPSAQADIF